MDRAVNYALETNTVGTPLGAFVTSDVVTGAGNI